MLANLQNSGSSAERNKTSNSLAAQSGIPRLAFVVSEESGISSPTANLPSGKWWQ